MKTRLARIVSRLLCSLCWVSSNCIKKVAKLGIANMTAQSSATSLRTLSAVSVAMLGIWLATVQTAREALTGIMAAFLAVARDLLAQVMLSTVRWR